MKKTKAQLLTELEKAIKACQFQFEERLKWEHRHSEEVAKNKELRQKYFCLCTALKEISEANLALTTVMERSV